MKCKNCQIELEQIEGKERKVFCSDKCRKAFNRKLTSDKPTQDNTEQTTPDKPIIPTSDKRDFSQFKVVGKDWKGGPMYLCGKHREHTKQYCEKMCDDNCIHVLKDRVVGQCRWCGRRITPEIYGNFWELVECCYSCTAERNKIKRELYLAR